MTTRISYINPIGTTIRATLVPPPVPLTDRYLGAASENADVSGNFWSEWQDLNLRPPRPERLRLLANLAISVP